MKVVQSTLSLAIEEMQADLEPPLSVPNLLKRFQEAYSRVELTVHNLNDTATVPSLLRSGDLDVAFYPSLSPRKQRALESTPLVKDTLAVICSERHPLRSKSSVSLSELEGEHFIDLPRERTLRSLIDQSFSFHGMTRITSFDISDEPTAVQFVKANLGIMFLPSALARLYAESRKICVLPAKPTLPKWFVSVVRRSQRAEAGKQDLAGLLLTMVRAR